MIICIYDVTKYSSCMIDDSLFEMIYYLSFWNDILKLLSFPQKRIVLTVPLKLFSFRYQVSTICWKIFYDSRFEMIYDFHFEMRNEFLFSFWNALWLSFRNEGAKFSSPELFSSKESDIFYWRKYPIIYIFRTQFFTQGLVPILALK